MRPLTLVGVVAAALTALVILWPRSGDQTRSACGPTESTPAEIGLDAAGTATVCLINLERTSRGLPALAQNALLAQAALEHSQDMVKRGYFEHTTPEGISVEDRLRAVGYGAGTQASGGENIEWGLGRQATPAAMVDTWMHSPGHRADILRQAFREIGIGIALGAPSEAGPRAASGATYTTDFGGVHDPSLQTG